MFKAMNEFRGFNSWVCRLLAPFVRVNPDELPRTLLSFLTLFLIMVSYYLMKPLRSAIALYDLGPEYIPLLYFIGVFLTLWVTVIYNQLSRKLSRQALIRLCFLVTIGFFLGFWAILSGFGASRGVAVAFNLLSSTYILFIMAIFWSLNHDLFTTDQASRLFGMILLGASLGQFGGGFLTGFLLDDGQKGGTENLLLPAALLLFFAYVIAEVLQRYNQRDPVAPGDDAPSQFRRFQDDGATLIKTPHVRYIAAVVILASTSLTFLDFQYQQLVAAQFQEKKLIAIHFGDFWKYNAALNVLFLLLFSGRALRFLGPGLTLAFLPLLCLVSALGFGLGGRLDWMMPLTILTMSFNYTLYNMGKEVLYIPLERDVRYRMKSFIDAFCFRFGDAFAALSMMILLHLASNSAYPFCRGILVCLALAWFPVLYFTNSSFLKISNPPPESATN